ncbi:MAG TPA: hypothetical protein DCM05_07320 [Elusimicrobia bacterium]|nr:hypothetical protein [Elusimicrobiota bacterium]
MVRREALAGILLVFLYSGLLPAWSAPVEEVNVLLTEAERLSGLREPQLKEALSKLDEALELVDPGSPDACPIFNRRARVLMDMGKFKEAEQDGLKSLAIRPSALAYLRVAMARLYAGSFPEAAEAAVRSVELYQAAPESKRELALAYEVSGCAKWRQADPAAGEDFAAAEETDPKRRGLLAEWREDRLFCCLPDRDARRVTALVDDALRLLRSEGRSREEARADRERSIQKLSEAAALAADRMEAHHLLNLRARVFNLIGQPLKAYADAAESLRIKPKGNPAACLEAALANLKSDKENSLRNAMNGLEQARSWDSPARPGVLARLYRVSGCAKLGLGKTQEARSDFVLMAELDKKAAAVLQEFDQGNSPCEDQSEDMVGDLRPFYLPLGLLAAAGLAAGAWALYRRRRKEEPGAAVAARPTAEAGSGRLAGKYEIVRVIGKGGMGAVYEATDHSLGRTVAIKKMAAQLAQMGPEGRKYFLKEAHNVAALRHSAIVDIYAVIEDGDDVYLVFELVRGKTVQHILAEQKRIPLGRVCEILRPVCQALHYAHGKQMIHRDLKPANIMVTDEGRIKLMDFGIARSVQDGVAFVPGGPAAPAATPADIGRYARTVNITGTPPYMSPETQQGIVCQEGDVYALGVVLYEILTGVLPFQGSDDLQQKMFMTYVPATTHVPGLPREVDEMIHASLQPDPRNRLRTAAEFLARLEAAAAAAGRT